MSPRPPSTKGPSKGVFEVASRGCRAILGLHFGYLGRIVGSEQVPSHAFLWKG